MLVPAVTVRTDVPEVVIELVLSVAESPFTSEMPSRVNFVVPVKLKGVTVRLKVALPPGFTVRMLLSTVSQ